MAVGDGGFSTQVGGFNKNEVNEYISNLRKKMNELEAEMKENDSKVKAAVKIADEADSKIQKIQKERDEKVAELELQIKSEHRKAEDLINQVDELKRKVKNGGSSSSSSSASNAEAQRQAAEIIASANKTAQETVDSANKIAREVVEKAKRTAGEIVANAQNASAAGGAARVNLDGFMSELKGFFEQVSSGYKKICEKAEEISSESVSAPAAATVEIPDFLDVEAPSAAAPAADISDFKEPEPQKEMSFEDMQTFEEEEEAANADIDDMMSGFGSIDESVTEVTENDTSEHSKAAFDMDFDKELIAQTVPSGSLNENDIDSDLLAAVREEEARHAVQPTPEEDRRDFDMDMSADDGDDAMRKMLEAAEAAFGGSGSNLDFDTDMQTEADNEPAGSNAAANPWEDLQKQLEAMEQSGNFGESEPAPEPDAKEPETQDVGLDDPMAPSTDDSSIWDFSSTGDGMNSGDDDDDMSSDLFGNF